MHQSNAAGFSALLKAATRGGTVSGLFSSDLILLREVRLIDQLTVFSWLFKKLIMSFFLPEFMRIYKKSLFYFTIIIFWHFFRSHCIDYHLLKREAFLLSFFCFCSFCFPFSCQQKLFYTISFLGYYRTAELDLLVLKI